MTSSRIRKRFVFVVFVTVAVIVLFSTQTRLRASGRRSPGRAYKTAIAPHWYADNTRFWYRNDLRGGRREFVAVDAVKGVRAPAFDHQRLARALAEAGVGDVAADRLPIESLEFDAMNGTLTFRAKNSDWRCDLQTYRLEKADRRKPAATNDPLPGAQGHPGPQPRPGPQSRPPRAPTSRDLWTYSVKDNNIFLRSKENGEEFQLSKDGTEKCRYGMLQWAPDGKMLVAFRITPGERKEVHLIESSPPGGGRAKLTSRPYALPGDRFTTYELNLFDPQTREQIKPEVGIIDLGHPGLRWSDDGRRFIYEKMDRGHQRFRLIEVDSHTGDVRNIIDEKTDTFIWSAHTENVPVRRLTWLSQTKEIVYASERDGWRHLYLVDVDAGKIKHQITKGAYVVRAVDRIDEQQRQIWFRASGKNPGQDPYLMHFYRVNFDGSGLVALTEGNGYHSVQYSPDRKYLIDTYSRVDMAPVHELRRTSDGRLMCHLEKADVSELEEAGWEPPEVFAAKGRDGKTDIWGIICRPRDFDPGKKYAVIEDLYAGPQSAYVPKTFSGSWRYTSLTDLGFIVVKIDGMGTAHRSKAFHDVCWHNLKDAGLPDRILWIKAAAKERPWMDLKRVGVYGNSAGGQNAAAAVLFHGEFYRAAVASCGCHDNRMDKASWNEQWMGYPVGPQYSECSNIDNAHRLQGHLMLVVGELDRNVPPESTMRFVHALIKADKDFDLIVIPGGGHGMGAYGHRRMRDFFVRHLVGSPNPKQPSELRPCCQ